jgi:hypothetical protein
MMLDSVTQETLWEEGGTHGLSWNIRGADLFSERAVFFTCDAVLQTLASDYPIPQSNSDWDEIFRILSENLAGAQVGSPGVRYIGQTENTVLLGRHGQLGLERVIKLFLKMTAQHTWPFRTIEVRYTRDPEVSNWEYALVALIFDGSFDDADRHLHEFYTQLDDLIAELPPNQRKALQEKVFFDIESARL